MFEKLPFLLTKISGINVGGFWELERTENEMVQPN